MSEAVLTANRTTPQSQLLSRVGSVVMATAGGMLVWCTGFGGRSFGPIRFLLKTLPYGDKVGHFVLYGALVFALGLIVRNQARAAGVALAVFVVGVVDEYRQLFVGGRNFDIDDILANAAGVCAGLLAALVVVRWCAGRSVEGAVLGRQNDELEQARSEDHREQDGNQENGSFAHVSRF